MISIIIPSYEMKGEGKAFLKQCLDSILIQDYNDWEVIVSDNSKDDVLEKLVEGYSEPRFKYFKSLHYGSAANTNYGMKLASGDLIKPMFQDDYFFSNNCLSELALAYETFKEKNEPDKGAWFAYGRVQLRKNDRKHYIPFWNPNIIRGFNTISTPSCIAFPFCYNTVPYRGLQMFFDETLNWFMDVDFYYRLFKLYGEPIVLNSIVAITEWTGRVTEGVEQELKLKEEEYLKRKYDLK